MSFDHTKIKTVNLNFNSGHWNPETHDIRLTYDPTVKLGFTMKLVPIEDDTILNFDLANTILDKIRNK